LTAIHLRTLHEKEKLHLTNRTRAVRSTEFIVLKFTHKMQEA